MTLANRKPCKVMPVPHTREPGAQFGDDRPSSGFAKAPPRNRVHADHGAPVAPAVDVVQGKVMFFCSRHHIAPLQVVAERKGPDLDARVFGDVWRCLEDGLRLAHGESDFLT